MKLIAGLGNPGPNYEKTPHNMGFLVVDCLARRLKIRFRDSDNPPALIARGSIVGEDLALLKPKTFMNLSGRAIAPLAQKHRLAPDELYVAVDDADLPLGAIRWRARGGDGGHKGLRSIIHEIESNDFVRLRIGVTPEEERPEDLETYVLNPFAPRELEWAERIAETAVDSILVALRDGLDRAANQFNGRRISPPGEDNGESGNSADSEAARKSLDLERRMD